MDANTVYKRTPKGNDEVENRTHKINIRLRTALLALNGREPVSVIIKRFGREDIMASFRELEAQGFIASHSIGASFDQNLRTLVGMIHELLGPNGDVITERVEELGGQLAQPVVVLQYLEQRKDLFEDIVGKQKSAAFFERTRKLLSPA